MPGPFGLPGISDLKERFKPSGKRFLDVLKDAGPDNKYSQQWSPTIKEIDAIKQN